MALMLSDLTAGLERLNAGAVGIANQHILGVMPKDNTATARAAEGYELDFGALTGVDVD